MKALNVTLSTKGVARWKAGHPWIYQSDIQAPKELVGGEVVRVVDARGYFLGQAFFSKASKKWRRACAMHATWMIFEGAPFCGALIFS